MNFLANKEQSMRKKTKSPKQSSKKLGRCFKIDLLMFSFCVNYDNDFFF